MTAIAYAADSPGLRLDLVIRTSKRKAEAKSPKQQRDMAESSANAHGHQIVYIHDSGTDESGKTMNRKSINDARTRLRAGLTDGIIVALADRIGRAPIEEAMTTVREFCTEGKLVLADMGGQPIDLTNSVSETNVVMQLQFARQYWLMTANRFLGSQADAIKAGKWIGEAPLGYEKTPTGERKGVLRPHPVNSGVITRAYELAAQAGLHAAVDYLQAALPGPRWDLDRVRRLLGSRCYLGELHYGNFTPNPKAHPALTMPTLWLAAQTEAHPRRRNGEYPLSHAIRCGRCHAGLVGALQSVGGRTYRRMRCSNPECRGGSSVSADRLEAHILGIMRTALADTDFRDQFAPEGLADAEAVLLSAEAERSALTTKVKPSHPDFTAWLADADAEVQAARQRYDQVARLVGESERLPLPEQLDDPVHFSAGLRAITRFDRITVRPGRGSIIDRVDFTPLDGDDVAGPLAA
jgi:DNA invertase Pin-like site-specific DNA recombinase